MKSFALFFAIFFPVLLMAEEPRTHENDPRVARYQERFPEADANKDGILTFEEAVAHRRNQTKPKVEDSTDVIQPTESNVSYGEHPRNVLDFYRAESEGATPLLIYFHGGGFVGGDKSKVKNLAMPKAALAHGISVISANYRFVKGEDSEPFPGSLMDGVRVVQYARFRAGDWNLDPEKVVVSGGSAGGCMSVWIGMRDDFANPKSEDPVERESSRVIGVIGYGAQTTLNPFTILDRIGGDPAIHGSFSAVYDVATMEDLKNPAGKAKMTEFSALEYVTPDDPPAHLSYNGQLAGTPLPPTASTGTSIHHPMFGQLLKEAYEALNMEVSVELVCRDCPNETTDTEFLLRVLGKDLTK